MKASDFNFDKVQWAEFAEPDSKVIDVIMQQWHDLHEKVVKDVLWWILKREPTIEDAKRCNRLVREGDDSGYTLAYRGITLGRVQFDYERHKISFIPSEEAEGKEIH